jgi:hypothetical protein
MKYESNEMGRKLEKESEEMRKVSTFKKQTSHVTDSMI